jgi:hypothetical protein
MAQQTAVEYLIEKLFTEYRFEFSGTIVDQAKQMEKEQIIVAYRQSVEEDVWNNPLRTGEEYYKETYEYYL